MQPQNRSGEIDGCRTSALIGVRVLLTRGDAGCVTTAISCVYVVHTTGRKAVAKKKREKEEESDLVSFRLEAEFRRLLQEKAAAHGQPRANLFARVLVQRA